MSNIAIGGYSLYGSVPAAMNANTTGSFNVAIGTGALKSNTTADYNTAVGYQAGYLVTGGANLCIGASSGAVLTTGVNNIYLANTSASSAGASQEIVLGATAASSVVGKGSNTGFIYPGGGGVYQGNNSSSWSTTSDQRLKKNIVDNTEGLDKINAIQVRNFEYRTADEVTELPAHCVIEKTGVQLGVIAQELQQVCPDCVKEESTGVLSVDSDNIFWHMVNAIKELKSELDTVKAELATLKGN
jgi:trimeric autotransporter adhesin